MTEEEKVEHISEKLANILFDMWLDERKQLKDSLFKRKKHGKSNSEN